MAEDKPDDAIRLAADPYRTEAMEDRFGGEGMADDR
jgi:hypothetical protein